MSTNKKVRVRLWGARGLYATGYPMAYEFDPPLLTLSLPLSTQFETNEKWLYRVELVCVDYVERTHVRVSATEATVQANEVVDGKRIVCLKSRFWSRVPGEMQ